jgi:hypothetical protein
MKIERLAVLFLLLIACVSGAGVQESKYGQRDASVLPSQGLAKKVEVAVRSIGQRRARKLCGKAGGKSSAGKSGGKDGRRRGLEDVCDDDYDSVYDGVRTYPPIGNGKGASGDTVIDGDDAATLDDDDRVEPEPMGQLTGADPGDDAAVAEDDDSMDDDVIDEPPAQTDDDGSYDDDFSISNDADGGGWTGDDDAEV